MELADFDIQIPIVTGYNIRTFNYPPYTILMNKISTQNISLRFIWYYSKCNIDTISVDLYEIYV